MRYLADDARRYLDLAHAEPEPVLQEMESHGRERGFPIVGPVVGRYLRLTARLVDARRVFEFGSGFGYSAAWVAGALPDDGEVVLTDYDADNLAEAEEFLERAGHAGKARFEAGDAMESFERYAGPFDVVLVDHDKSRYVEAFEMAREKLADGGVVIADNILAGPASLDDLLPALDGEPPADDSVAGIADYVAHVRDDPEFETSVLPIGSGIAVSTPK